jgi:hypothetical protein
MKTIMVSADGLYNNRESFTLQEAVECGARFFVPLMS